MIKSAFKGAVLAGLLTVGATATTAGDLSDAEVALFLTIKTQPGQRDALVALWDAHLKTRAAEDADHLRYVFALDMGDPDTVHITEVYATQTAFEQNAQSPWFAAYMTKAAELLAGEPGFAMASPYWVK
ncbi:MAG: antibiotic biosynthesis monooxygenase [Pseudomonadota bacterium]